MKNPEFYYSSSPITGERMGPFKNMAKEEVNTIISNARVNQKIWSHLPI